MLELSAEDLQTSLNMLLVQPAINAANQLQHDFVFTRSFDRCCPTIPVLLVVFDILWWRGTEQRREKFHQRANISMRKGKSRPY